MAAGSSIVGSGLMARFAKGDPDAPDLDRVRIVTASLELIDRDGLDAFSVRALARHLGVANMSVYHYVRSREELLSSVLDGVLGEVDLRPAADDALAEVMSLSERFADVFAEHPATIPLLVLEPVISIGPHGAAVFDRFVELFRAAGLDDRRVAESTVALIEYLCGHLIGRYVDVRRSHDGRPTSVDDALADLPGGTAPNIRALAQELRTAASARTPTPGIALILAGASTADVDTIDR